MSRTITFIENHEAAMDLCQHPWRQGIHGFTAWSAFPPQAINFEALLTFQAGLDLDLACSSPFSPSLGLRCTATSSSRHWSSTSAKLAWVGLSSFVTVA